MAEHVIITIGRQFGSGGHEIGRMLAQELGYTLYDKELLKLQAENSGNRQTAFCIRSSWMYIRP